MGTVASASVCNVTMRDALQLAILVPQRAEIFGDASVRDSRALRNACDSLGAILDAFQLPGSVRNHSGCRQGYVLPHHQVPLLYDRLCGCSVQKGRDLSAVVQQHLEEAMQPDGADLEYIYLPGSSRPPSASHRPRSALEQAEQHAQHTPGRTRPQGGWREEPLTATSPHHAARFMLGNLSDWAALPVSRRSSSGLRPATAQPRNLRRGWDDSLAGAPPRAHAAYEGAHSRGRRRPRSAGPTQWGRHGGTSWYGGAEVGGGRFRGREAMWRGGAGCADHPAALLTGMHDTPYTEEYISKQIRAEGLGDHFQSPMGSWYPERAEAPVMDAAWGGTRRTGTGHVRGSGGQVEEMQRVYADQIHEMLRYANQCAAVLGLRYRYKAARRRPSSALASRGCMPAAIEGCVERYVVSVRNHLSWRLAVAVSSCAARRVSLRAGRRSSNWSCAAGGRRQRYERSKPQQAVDLPEVCVSRGRAVHPGELLKSLCAWGNVTATKRHQEAEGQFQW